MTEPDRDVDQEPEEKAPLTLEDHIREHPQRSYYAPWISRTVKISPYQARILEDRGIPHSTYLREALDEKMAREIPGYQRSRIPPTQ